MLRVMTMTRASSGRDSEPPLPDSGQDERLPSLAEEPETPPALPQPPGHHESRAPHDLPVTYLLYTLLECLVL